MFVYKVLTELPPVPQEFINQALDFVAVQYHEAKPINTWAMSVHGRPIYQGGKQIGESSSQIRKHFSDTFEQWIKENIIEEFLDWGVVATTPKMNYVGPHTDIARQYSLIFPIELGGDEVTTSFWIPADGSPPPYAPTYSNYDDLIKVGDLKANPLEWYILNSKIIHSVENISQGRITIQVSLDHNPWGDP